jgi:hypothetical protein
LLNGRENQQTSSDTDSAILTANTDTNTQINWLQKAIPEAKADPAWSTTLSDKTRSDCENVEKLISAWANENDTSKKDNLRPGIGDASRIAIDPTLNTDLHDATATPIRHMRELLGDIRNAGTDHSNGQRNIYGNHAYSVVSVSFKDQNGILIELGVGQTVAKRTELIAKIDPTKSIVTLLNPHHANRPNMRANETTNADGEFTMSLEQFLWSFESVDHGVFPRTGTP